MSAVSLPLELLRGRVAAHPRPLVFATVSGAHLYGFPSADSDFDLRGVHLCPVSEVVGLLPEMDTIEIDNKATMAADGIEFDIVSHDAKKFFTLLLRKNGYVLEQLYSPLVVHTSEAHQELKRIAAGCITRHHAHHYLGFAETQWRLFEKEHPRRVKPLLYTYRVLLTGIHLMKTGRVEANLVVLNEEAKLPQVPELVARKLAGPEQSALPEGDFAFHAGEIQRLTGELEAARDRSGLPEAASALPALNELLVRWRLGTLAG
jgi:predicted nucleotidyltransferase